MIIYNKNLQKILSIGIEQYKIISGKYILGERNGYGKEYEYKKNNFIGKGIECNNNEILLFEGEYLNGKRNGKGKEIDYDCRLIYEGEYLNGEKNGKGKECYFDGKLIFEGEYLNGKRWNGKGYNKFGELVFELKNGNGKGK